MRRNREAALSIVDELEMSLSVQEHGECSVRFRVQHGGRPVEKVHDCAWTRAGDTITIDDGKEPKWEV